MRVRQGERYRWWPSASKHEEPKEVTIAPFLGELTGAGLDWIILREDGGIETSIQDHVFLSRRHQLLETVTAWDDFDVAAALAEDDARSWLRVGALSDSSPGAAAYGALMGLAKRLRERRI